MFQIYMALRYTIYHTFGPGLESDYAVSPRPPGGCGTLNDDKVAGGVEEVREVAESHLDDV